MSTVTEHYESHLARIYVWMAGGIEHAVQLGAGDIAEFLEAPGVAVDLGAGFGMHTIPLARAGYKVLAVDTSVHLLGELQRECSGLPVEVANANLLDFTGLVSSKADLVLCMGDTLTHLESSEQVVGLMLQVKAALSPGGHFIATFRDYQRPLTGVERFALVRGDSERILTCFLEDAAQHVLVHDVLHERTDGAWNMKVSSYQKLRISPRLAMESAKAAGLKCQLETGPRGMVKIRATH
jgi:SAM-dependent methyltransferase